MRRLPVYFLVDVSVASDIYKLKMCLEKFLPCIRETPYLVETAYVSIITFGDIAKIALPLTNNCDIKTIPMFKAEKRLSELR